MPTALIGSTPIRRHPGRFREILEAAGFTPIDPPGLGPITIDDVRGADAIIAGGEPFTAEMIAAAPGLRVIARTGVGYDAVSLAEATARKIAVTVTPGTNHESVAEQAFALLLAVTRNVVALDRGLRVGLWDRTPQRPLRGTTLGLVGLGRIGRAMAIRALAFGMKVVAFDTLADVDFDARHGIRRLDLPALLAEADVVSLHLPSTDATRGLFNSRTFAMMRPGAILLNTARGNLVVEADLAGALRSGQLGGAGLDVFNHEPPEPGNPLLALPNVVLSPHVAGSDILAMADMAALAARCVVDLHEGRWPEGCVVNEELRAGWTW